LCSTTRPAITAPELRDALPDASVKIPPSKRGASGSLLGLPLEKTKMS
jgi:hypothetical protein